MILLLLLFVSGCEACMKTIPLKSEDSTFIEVASRFVIDPESIFTKASQFSYKSDMTILVGKGDSVEDNHEIVEIIAKNPHIIFKKKIDKSHFLEIVKYEDNFFVKNANGSWRQGINDTPVYKNLLHDGLNITAWVIDQCGLDAQLVAIEDSASKSFSIKQGSISKDAPFLKGIANKIPQFSTIHTSVVNATVIVDKETAMPISAIFDIAITGQQQHWIRITASMALDMASIDQDILRPEIKNEKPVTVPVNIRTRFNQLVEREKGAR